MGNYNDLFSKSHSYASVYLKLEESLEKIYRQTCIKRSPFGTKKKCDM